MSSRESYQAPTAGGGAGDSSSHAQNTFGAGSSFGAGGGANAGASASGGSLLDQGGPTTQYQCGDCASKVQLKKGDPIRCKECGHRVLYKERTRRMVQFEAR